MLTELSQEQKVHHLSGALDAQVIGPVQHDFDKLLSENDNDIILDFTEVNFLDSSGIGSLVYLHKRLVADKRSLTLSGLSGQPKKIISFLRIDKIIKTLD